MEEITCWACVFDDDGDDDAALSHERYECKALLKPGRLEFSLHREVCTRLELDLMRKPQQQRLYCRERMTSRHRLVCITVRTIATACMAGCRGMKKCAR